MSQPVDTSGMNAPPDIMGFDDPVIAAKARDIMTTHIEKVSNRINPPSKKGRVVSIDFVNYKAQVWFPSDTQPIPVNLFPSTLPGLWDTKFGGTVSTATQGAGSQVLVQKFFDSLYVTEILTGGQFAADWATAGNQIIALGPNGLPEFVRGGDYTVRPVWTGDTTLPSSGGPYAINIGPFTRNFTVDQAADFNDRGDIWDGLFEVEVVSSIGASKYRFGLNPERQALTSAGNCFRGPANGYGGSQDTWYKVLPDSYQFDNDLNGPVINLHQYFDLAGVPNLYDWNNTADTQVTVTAVSTPVDAGAFAVASMKMQSNVSHATLKIAEGSTTRYPVAANASYAVSTRLYATVVTADSRVGIDWYDINNTLISSPFSGSATNLAVTTWTSVFATFTAPVNAAYCNPYIRIAGTPAITTIFYCSIFQFLANDIGSQSDYSLDVGMRQTIHGAPGADPTWSPGEVWLRIYIDFLQGNSNGSSEISFTVRFRNLASWNYPKSTKTGLVVFEYDITPVANNGILGYTDGNNGWSTQTGGGTPLDPSAPASTGPWRNPDLLIGNRAMHMLSGGGLINYTGGFLKWSVPFELGGIGRSRRGLPLGKATLTCPTSGTINVYPGNIFTGLQTVTCTATGVPLVANQSLWWGIPPGVQSTTPPVKTYQNADARLVGGLFIVDNINSAGIWSPPEWAICLAYVNTAGTQVKCNGQFVGGTAYLFDVNTAAVNIGGNTLTLGSGAASGVIIPGVIQSGDEVFGSVAILAGGSVVVTSTVSYANLSGGGAVNAVVTGNTGSVNFVWAAATAPGATSVTVGVYRLGATGTNTTIYYRVKQAP